MMIYTLLYLYVSVYSFLQRFPSFSMDICHIDDYITAVSGQALMYHYHDAKIRTYKTALSTCLKKDEKNKDEIANDDEQTNKLLMMISDRERDFEFKRI